MIDTKRFILKPLTKDYVNYNYLSWLTLKNTGSYIDYAKKISTLADLKQYVKNRENRRSVLFLAIFTKKTHQHIGNIKYEPIDFKNKKATMGILIGDKNWRGKGVASEVITASNHYLKNNCNIQTIFLGVHQKNIFALLAYQKIGFDIVSKNDNNLTMSLLL